MVRHGRTAWNAEGRYQGWTDVPLDDTGRQQSEEVAKRLAGELAQGTPVWVLSSDLKRAAGTATAIAAQLTPGVEPTLDPAMREVDVGGWGGLTRAEVAERFPVEFEQWYAGQDVSRGGGEKLSDAGRRVASCLVAHLSSRPGATLVAVGHGMSLRMALEQLASVGVIDFAGPSPHLGNAQYMVLAVRL